MSDPRIVPCSDCGTEGVLRWDSCQRDEYGNVMEHTEECSSCDGTGGAIIEAEPIDMNDLDAMAGEPA
jgi:DnaJ-class molecular chaperone